MRWTLGSTIILGAAMLGAVMLSDGINLCAQTDVENTSLQPAADAEIHETRFDSVDAGQFSNPNEATTAVEAFLPAPSTRSSFMATWEIAAGATGYLLDVSTSPSFEAYVDGYHDLDVGNVTASAVTGLSSGATYYYRVRA